MFARLYLYVFMCIRYITGRSFTEGNNLPQDSTANYAPWEYLSRVSGNKAADHFKKKDKIK